MNLDGHHPDAELQIDGYTVQRVNGNHRPTWVCDCEEFNTIQPLTAKAWCRHCSEAAGFKRQI